MHRSFFLYLAAAATLSCVALTPLTNRTLLAQDAVSHAVSAPAPSRVTAKIDDNVRVTLSGTVHRLAKPSNDRGVVPDSTPMKRVQLLLKQSDAQSTALKQLIDDLHNPQSPSYHHWLTPAQFGQQFGPSDTDVAAVETWLAGKGFSSVKLNPGKQTLEFEGTAAQFRNAFHSEIHKYQVAGATRYSNSVDPQIPAALSPVLNGFVSLNNFPKKSYMKNLGKASYNPVSKEATPSWTIGTQSAPTFLLSPGDYAVQYDLNPLYNASVNGSGQSIAIINEANINVYLVNQFRSLFGLSANPPQVIIDGQDPGIDGINDPFGPNYASDEAYLDVEWAGAVAPQATVNLVIAADTIVTDGLDLAAERAVYSNIAPVMSLSFGNCEVDLGSENQFYNALWQQAAAQGITAIVSAGDNGSAGCDDDNSQAYAVDGQAVNGLASTPYNIAVGGTDFYYSAYNQGSTAINAQLATYWNTTPSNNTPTVSIKGYVPEQPWNNSQYGLNLVNYYSTYGDTTIVGGSGGASTCGVPTLNSSGSVTACTPYAKPAWQTGTGVPADGARDLPDVSLFAANGFNDSLYPVCIDSGDCQAAAAGGVVQVSGIGGTSASAPSFAGVMALVNQKYGRQGQANYTLYPLAKQFPAAFHDVTVGTNTVPCAIGTTQSGVAPHNCIAVSNSLTGSDDINGAAAEGEIGTGTTAEYNATAGYDLATGLGTLDTSVMVNDWNKVVFTGTATTLTPSQTSFTHGTAITLSGNVTGTSGTPTGSVAVLTTSTEQANQGQAVFSLNAGAYTGSANYLPGGTYTIYGRYGGDGSNASSSSTPVTLTVAPESSATSLILANLGAGQVIGSGTTNVPYGTSLDLSALVGPSAQITTIVNCEIYGTATCPSFQSPTGTVTFSDNGAVIHPGPLSTAGEVEYNYAAPVGTHSVSASYSGDNSYNASSAAAQTFTVVKDAPNGYIAATNLNGSTGQVVAGQQTFFTVIIENSAAVNGFATAPTGSVTVSGFPGLASAAYTLYPGVDPSTQAPASIATVPVPASAPAGTYTINISYPGDTNYSSLAGPLSLQFISPGTGQTPTFTASVAPSSPTPAATSIITATLTGSAGVAPTGTLAVYSNGFLLGSIGVPASSSASTTVSVALSSASLFQGVNILTLQYSGDSRYLPAATSLTITNTLADFTLIPQTALITSAATGVGSDAISLSSATSFTGAVNLSCKSPTGLACSVYPSSVSLSSGSALATVITTESTVGTYNVVITGTDSTGQIIHTVGLQVTGTSVSGTTPAITVVPAGPVTVATPGTTGSTPLYVASSGGFSGSVNLTCAVTTSISGATDAPTCSITSPVSVTSTTAGSATLSVSTTAKTSSLDRPFGPGFAPAAGGVALASFVMLLVPRRRRKFPLLLLVFALTAVLGAVSGCGSGSPSSGTTTGGGTTPNPGTTVGAYTVTVNATDVATGKVTASAAVNLTVN